MKLGLVAVILCVSVNAVMGTAMTYTFQATGGSIVLNLAGQGSTTSGATGTFAVTIDQGPDNHVGVSDTFILEDAALSNVRTLSFSLGGLARASIVPGNARFLDFAPDGWDHIASGGTSAVNTDVYVETTTFITGLYLTTFQTAMWAGQLLPFGMTFTTSAAQSDILTATLAGTYGISMGVPDISLTLTLDLILNVEGTAHAVPDPSLFGLVALGLGGSGLWLRARRR